MGGARARLLMVGGTVTRGESCDGLKDKRADLQLDVGCVALKRLHVWTPLRPGVLKSSQVRRLVKRITH